ncbi:hypothetical protein SKAU_G00347870 [Synaphobranchus kaupii]|uniref:Uncharacterized protein n=1 Tax=Synaphobranchus kaupii TaxID=118154 RepID=A0A9Q1IHX7_SYNKA|nr:hypothetical protein SKAU_G00347870 [Synaphobranchus kaupii]
MDPDQATRKLPGFHGAISGGLPAADTVQPAEPTPPSALPVEPHLRTSKITDKSAVTGTPGGEETSVGYAVEYKRDTAVRLRAGFGLTEC